MKTWFDGNDVDFDFSLLRPAGARLKIILKPTKRAI
jgi:hypothetical protein